MQNTVVNSLPEQYLITPEPQNYGDSFLLQLEKNVESYYKFVLLRSKFLNKLDYISLCKAVIKICHKHNSLILLNQMPEKVIELEADGIHFSAKDMFLYNTRMLPDNLLIGASCHSVEEISQAEKISADFSVLSPIQPSEKGGYRKEMGWKNFSRLCSKTKIPIYALGGVSCDDLALAKKNGAYGVSGISKFWK
jgi:thiamine-phosphate diphosphorylase